MALADEQLTYIIHHVVFPPKRPQTEESEANGNGNGLLALVADAAQKYHACSSPPWQQKWSAAARAMQVWTKIQDDTRVVKETLVDAIGSMGARGSTERS